MQYQHRFRVNASQSQVAAFHQDPASLSGITPPPIRLQPHRLPAALAGGGEMEFTLWFGLLPIRWVINIEAVSASGFTDRQLRGPFKQWVHRHSFVRVDDQTTEVVDQISLELKPHPFWGLVGLGFALGLPALFAYRGWKTRRHLEISNLYQRMSTKGS